MLFGLAVQRKAVSLRPLNLMMRTRAFGESIFRQPIGVSRRRLLMRIDERVHPDAQTNCCAAKVTKPYSRPVLTRLEPTPELVERFRIEMNRSPRVEPQ